MQKAYYNVGESRFGGQFTTYQISSQIKLYVNAYVS